MVVVDNILPVIDPFFIIHVFGKDYVIHGVNITMLNINRPVVNSPKAISYVMVFLSDIQNQFLLCNIRSVDGKFYGTCILASRWHTFSEKFSIMEVPNIYRVILFLMAGHARSGIVRWGYRYRVLGWVPKKRYGSILQTKKAPGRRASIRTE